jgi:hypothetical protein
MMMKTPSLDSDRLSDGTRRKPRLLDLFCCAGGAAWVTLGPDSMSWLWTSIRSHVLSAGSFARIRK